MISNGRLKVLKTLKTDAETAALEIDPDLENLLENARASKGVVVRSAPVYKLRSFLSKLFSGAFLQIGIDVWVAIVVHSVAQVALLQFTKAPSAAARPC